MIQRTEATSDNRQKQPHVYTEEERRLRWVLIIDAILTDPGLVVSKTGTASRPPAILREKQTV